MICIRRARPMDAPAIAAVHVAAWRSAFAGILPDEYLAGLSEARLAGSYRHTVLDRRAGHAVFVAVTGAAEVVGFASGGRARQAGVAEGEIETLYLLDDYRDMGIGRRLMRAMAAHLRAVGCASAMTWVLHENPSRFFYRRLGGRPVMREAIQVAGLPTEQVAMLWDPIDGLLAATAPAREG